MKVSISEDYVITITAETQQEEEKLMQWENLAIKAQSLPLGRHMHYIVRQYISVEGMEEE